MRRVLVILLLICFFSSGCFTVKENEVNLSIMRLEKINILNETEQVYVWHIIKGERKGEILYSFGKENSHFVPGDIAYVFVKKGFQR